MGCGNTKSSQATQPSEAPTTKKESGEPQSEPGTRKEADTTLVVLPFEDPFSKIDKDASRYKEEKKLIKESVALFKHTKNGFFVVRKTFDFEEEKEEKEMGDLLHQLSEPNKTEPDRTELTKLRHPHVVCYLWTEMRDSKNVDVFLEYCNGASLNQLIESRQKNDQPFNEEEMRRYLLHMALGLSFIHSRNIIHRNVRPSNVMLSADEKVAKIGDFGEGAALKTGKTVRVTKAGSELYMAPEMADKKYSFPVDIWALWIILHKMATYSVPFKKITAIPSLENPNSSVVSLDGKYSDKLQQLAERMGQVPASMRPTSAEIAEELQKL